MNNVLSRKLNRTLLNQLTTRPLLLLLSISVLLRVITAFVMGDAVIELPGVFDQLSYHNLALRVVNGYGFSFGELWWPVTPADAPTAHWSYLYTLFVAGVYCIFGPHPLIARLLQAVIVGILHPYIVYRLSEKLFGQNIAWVAAIVTSFYFYFIYYDAALMTEPFYITAILFTLYIAIQLADSENDNKDARLGFLLGMTTAVTLLLRQVFLLFVPFLLLWIWSRRLKKHKPLPVFSTILTIVTVILFILPVTIYNQNRFGSFVLLNTNSGYAFFWGNHPIYGTHFEPILSTGTYQALIPQELLKLNEADLDRELLKRGIGYVVDDPKRYILLSISRIPPYFMFWSSAKSSLISNIARLGSFGIMFPFMIYGLWLKFKEFSTNNLNSFLNMFTSREGLLLLFVCIYSIVHILTWTLIRYRLPVDAVLLPFASLALVTISQKFLPRYPN